MKARLESVHRGAAWVGIGAIFVASLARAELDFSDFDDFLMQSMERTLKALEPRIRAHDIAAATDDAESLREGLQWAEQYFTRKGSADDAVTLAKQGQELAATVVRSLAAKDFDGAATAARGVAKTCRSCHDAYRP